MRALTFWPEWVPTILSMGKDVENRPWPLPGSQIGNWIALHAGKYIGGRLGDCEDGLFSVVETAGRAGVPYDDLVAFRQYPGRIPRSSIVALIRFGTPIRFSDSRWAFPGSWHWPITGLRRLSETVPCKGAQGLWTVPADVERLVLERAAPEGP